MKKNDMFLGFYLLAAVIFFIIPLKSWMLDILILFNISMALIIVFNCLFAKETLGMSGFPTLLLFTTIFRISLNVSSTRLILSTGNPGRVVVVFLRRRRKSYHRCYYFHRINYSSDDDYKQRYRKSF